MKILNLVKITDTSGKVIGNKDGITYQALDERGLDDLFQLESEYSYIGRDFKVELMGEVNIPSFEAINDHDEQAD